MITKSQVRTRYEFSRTLDKVETALLSEGDRLAFEIVHHLATTQDMRSE